MKEKEKYKKIDLSYDWARSACAESRATYVKAIEPINFVYKEHRREFNISKRYALILIGEKYSDSCSEKGELTERVEDFFDMILEINEDVYRDAKSVLWERYSKAAADVCGVHTSVVDGILEEYDKKI